MGVPASRLICASNENKVLTDFINTGIYDVAREFYLTNSPSMDILISSNLERLLYHLSGNDGTEIAALMESLEKLWFPKIQIDAPETVFVNIKKANETTYCIHFLNYAPESVSQGIRIAIPGKDIAISEASVARPMDNKPKEAVLFGSDSKGMKSASLPGFDKYALVALKTKSKSD